MTEDPLNDDEIKRIRALLVYADQVAAEAKYQAALQLVLRTWKGSIIAIGAVAVVVLLLWDRVRALWAWLSP